jgi:hypothetical protein
MMWDVNVRTYVFNVALRILACINSGLFITLPLHGGHPFVIGLVAFGITLWMWHAIDPLSPRGDEVTPSEQTAET